MGLATVPEEQDAFQSGFLRLARGTQSRLSSCTVFLEVSRLCLLVIIHMPCVHYEILNALAYLYHPRSFHIQGHFKNQTCTRLPSPFKIWVIYIYNKLLNLQLCYKKNDTGVMIEKQDYCLRIYH